MAKSAIDPEEIDALIERVFHVIDRDLGQRLLWRGLGRVEVAQTTLWPQVRR
jgi:hypothetical protein